MFRSSRHASRPTNPPPPVMFALASTLVLCALTAPGVGAQGDAPGPRLPGLYQPLQVRVDSLYHAGRQEESLKLLEERLKSAPDDYGAQVLAARAALVLGYAAAYEDEARVAHWLNIAIDHGHRAMALQPLGEDGRYLTLAAEGRLAFTQPALGKARLAATVDSAARALIAEDSLHAGAHDALGRIYLEVSRLSWFERLVARPWLGGGLVSKASLDRAERELRRAVDLDPRRNLYYVDLADLLVARGRTDEARTVAEAGLKVPLEFPQEEHAREDLRRILREIGGPPASGLPQTRH